MKKIKSIIRSHKELNAYGGIDGLKLAYTLKDNYGDVIYSINIKEGWCRADEDIPYDLSIMLFRDGLCVDSFKRKSLTHDKVCDILSLLVRDELEVG